MDNDDLQPLVDDLAARLQRSVAIDDPSVRLIAVSKHFGDEDPLRVASVLNRAVSGEVTSSILALGIAKWTKPGWVEPKGVGLERRLCVPARCDGRLMGYLWLIDNAQNPLAQAEVDMASEAATRAGAVLFRRVLLRERSKARHESILRELVSSDHAVRAQAAEDLRAEQLFPEAATHFQVIAAQRGPTKSVEPAQDAAVEAAVEDGLHALPEGSALVAANRSRAWLLLGQPVAPSERKLCEVTGRIAARSHAVTDSTTRFVIGVGDPVREVGQIVDSYRQALLATRAALLVPSIGQIARWGRLGPYELLLRMPSEDVLRAAHVPALSALEASDRHGVLMETLESFFDNAGEVRRTAELLCVHRATLYHRLKRIEQLTGMNLERGDDRLTLHLGLKLRGLAAAYRQQLDG